MRPAGHCRRSTRRLALPEDVEGVIEFGYPAPDQHRCTMTVEEISNSGLSFVLAYELPGLEIGRNLDRVTVRIGTVSLRGDLVVMRLTPDGASGTVCGALFYPGSDADIVKLRKLVADLEARQSGAAASA